MLPQQTPQKAFFLPDFCNGRILLTTIVAVELLAIVLAVAQRRLWYEMLESFAFISFFGQWVTLFGAFFLCRSKVFLRRLGNRDAAWLSFFFLQLLVIFFSLLVGLFLGYIWPIMPFDLGYFLAGNLLISSIVIGLLWRYLYLGQRAESAAQAQMESRLAALQARIRPHFLFNTLNSLASLIGSDAVRAERLVEDLAALFRASLNHRRLHSLAEELEWAQRYLAIEQLRLGDRLQLDWSVQEGLGERLVPPLVLQPLLENAVYHGVETALQKTVVALSIGGDAKASWIRIRNPLQKNPATRKEGLNMAQQNIAQRLQMLFGEQARMDIATTAGQYQITLHIPLRSQR